MRDIQVSICCLAYNHEPFIRECLDGFLMQKTNFTFEILIHDDASTDGTANIIREYEKKFPKIIKPIYQKTNQHSQGIKPTIKYQFPRAKGKYIALCEGDDYWTDPLKLQKQVDFLEANQDYNICFHAVKVLNQFKNCFEEDSITRNVLETTTVEDLAKGNYIHTPSVVFRNDFIIPKWFHKTPIGDWTLYMINIKDRKIKKLEDVMAVYRVHGTSIWSNKTKDYRILNTIKAYKLVVKSNNINRCTKNELKIEIKNLRKQLTVKESKFVYVLKRIKMKFS